MKSVLRISCLMWLFASVPTKGAVVHFADENLKAAIQDVLFIWWEPTEEDLMWVTSMDLRERGIEDLTGIEAASNLQTLNLRRNRVKDVSPLESLTQLRRLDLSENGLNDLSGVAALTQLVSLDAHGNGVTDLSPLSGMRQLVSLTLRDNKFQGNLSALSSLTGLEFLDLQDDHVRDLRDLSGLTELKELTLSYNSINDVSVLGNMTQLEAVYLGHNLLSDITKLTQTRNLKALVLKNNPLNGQAYRDLLTIHDNNPNIDLRYDSRNMAPAGVQATRGTEPDGVDVTWQAVANGPLYTSYYRVYRAAPEDSTSQAVSRWQTETSFYDATAIRGITYTYWVQTALSDQGLDTGELSTPVQVQGLPTSKLVLSMFPTVGASVSPEPGTYTFESGVSVDISTQSLDPNLFVFTGWAGSAVDNGRVLDPNESSTVVMMDANESLVAIYHTALQTLVVDANVKEEAPQQGTEAHPLARIQDAVALAVNGTSVLVRPGVYQEHVDFQGKAIQLIGDDPNRAESVVYPVIMADQTGPVVKFVSQESSGSLLTGFVLLGGQGGIVCEHSSPTIMNCVVAGTQISDPNQGAVHLANSEAFLSHLTISDNLCPLQGAGLVLDNSQCLITNSIVWNNFSGAVRAGIEDRSLIMYSNIQGGWAAGDSTQVDLEIIDRWPLFVSSGKWLVPEEDPNALVFVPGDYHLRSQAGHWDVKSQVWVVDNQTSPSIDAGDPMSPVGMEPMPHGSRINQGAFGATSQASLSTR